MPPVRVIRGRHFEPTTSWAASRRSAASALKSPANGSVALRAGRQFWPRKRAQLGDFGHCVPNVAGETNSEESENRRFVGEESGARRIRTADLLGAIQARV